MQTVKFSIPTAIAKELTVALVADLHNRPYRQVISGIEKSRPDLIAVPDDLLVYTHTCQHRLGFLRDAALIAHMF